MPSWVKTIYLSPETQAEQLKLKNTCDDGIQVQFDKCPILAFR